MMNYDNMCDRNEMLLLLRKYTILIGALGCGAQGIQKVVTKLDRIIIGKHFPVRFNFRRMFLWK